MDSLQFLLLNSAIVPAAIAISAAAPIALNKYIAVKHLNQSSPVTTTKTHQKKSRSRVKEIATLLTLAAFEGKTRPSLLLPPSLSSPSSSPSNKQSVSTSSSQMVRDK
ncbi:hypothetical protein T439DRAFT_31318 [Meredithblackwellia eburnea MCA 4105]